MPGKQEKKKRIKPTLIVSGMAMPGSRGKRLE